MAPLVAYLVTEATTMTLQIGCILLNGFLVFMFVRVKRLYRSASMRLMGYLALTEFGFAVLTLPYTSYLIIMWNPEMLDYNPYMMKIASIPFIIHLKSNITLTMAIAMDRLLALFFPMYYRRRNHKRYALLALIVGLLLGSSDIIIEFIISPIFPHPNCAANGCFASADFRYYWGTTNMFLGLLAALFTMPVIYRLKMMESKAIFGELTDSAKSRRVSDVKDAMRYSHANRSSMAILMFSLIFITAPSVGVGVGELMNYSLFERLGPFYIVGLYLAGCFNILVYVLLSGPMKKLAWHVLCCDGANIDQHSTFLT